jgi:hypothetical protein
VQLNAVRGNTLLSVYGVKESDTRDGYAQVLRPCFLRDGSAKVGINLGTHVGNLLGKATPQCSGLITTNDAVTTKVVSSVGAKRELRRFAGCNGAGVCANNAMFVDVGARAIRWTSRSVPTFTGQRSCPHAHTLAQNITVSTTAWSTLCMHASPSVI